MPPSRAVRAAARLCRKRGEVIGLTGYSFTRAGYALAASAGDLIPRVQRIIEEGDLPGVGTRSLPEGDGRRRASFLLANYWDQQVYAFTPSAGDEIEFELTGNDGNLWVIDSRAQFTELEAPRDGVVIEASIPHFLVIEQNESLRSRGYALWASKPILTPFDDPDDGRGLEVGESLLGALDFPSDYDWFHLELERGDKVEILIESHMVNPYVIVHPRQLALAEQILSDDNSGGLFGTDAKIVLRADSSGVYFVVVRDADFEQVGGYRVSVAEADPKAPVTQPTA